MKKNIILIISALLVFIFVFSGCSNDNPKPLYIYYNDSLYTSFIDSDYTYSSLWFPLIETDIEDEAYFCEVNESTEKIVKSHKVSIKKFSDPSLNMFIVNRDFWGDFLNCKTDYNLPTINDGEIEALIIKIDAGSEWTDEYNNKKCKIIDDEIIGAFVDNISNINSTNDKFDTLSSAYEVGIKYKNINAVYYLGMLSSDAKYFYRADLVPNTYYKLNENLSSYFTEFI